MNVVMMGCGNPEMVDESQSVEVNGVITLDGKPLSNAEVTFLPADGDPLVGPALVITDNKGSYDSKFKDNFVRFFNLDKLLES